MVLHKQGGSTSGLIETDTWDPLLLCVWAELARNSVVKSQQQSRIARDNSNSEGGEGKIIIDTLVGIMITTRVRIMINHPSGDHHRHPGDQYIHGKTAACISIIIGNIGMGMTVIDSGQTKNNAFTCQQLIQNFYF